MPTKSKNFRLGQLSTLGQVIRALGKTVRAMASGTISTQDGVRICHSLGILRTCFESRDLELIRQRMEEVAAHAAAAAIEHVGERSGMLIEHIEPQDREPSLQ
jgi:hypothetical protein